MVEYKKRLVEVDEILKYLSEENLEKIPEDIRNAIKQNKAKDYEWHYDESKKLNDQIVSRDTIAILSFLNMKYLLDVDKRVLMNRIHYFNEHKNITTENLENEKIGYNFFESNDVKTKDAELLEKKQMIEYKEGFFSKIITKIKTFFINRK